MSELVLRAGHNDHRVIEELLTDPTALPARSAARVRRIVVDATAAVGTPVYAKAARDAGVQLLIDPMTHLLMCTQDVDDSWARLAFTGGPSGRTVADFMTPAARLALIESVVEFELDHGATAIIPPYIHLGTPEGVPAAIAQAFVRETAQYVHEDLGLNMPLFPVLSIDRTGVPLDRNAWEANMGKLLRSYRRQTEGGPFGLALSGAGRLNATNVSARSRIWRRAATIGPYIAWNAGDLGPMAVSMGAAGYSSGMATGERHDVRSAARNRAPGNNQPGPRYVGAYIDVLGRSLGTTAVRSLVEAGGAVVGDLSCTDPACCPKGFDSMLGSRRRQHAASRRLAELEHLDGISARAWKLHYLQSRSEAAVASAMRIRAAADRRGVRIGAYLEE